MLPSSIHHHNNNNKINLLPNHSATTSSIFNHYEREHKVLMIASLPFYTSFYETSPCTFHYDNKKKTDKNQSSRNDRRGGESSNKGCYYGDRCMFSHSAICKHYKQSENDLNQLTPICKFGKNCKYLHIDFKDTKAKRELKVLANSSQFSDMNRTDWFIRKENPLKKHNLKGFIDLVGINGEENESDRYISIVDMQLNENGAYLALSDGTVWNCSKEALVSGIHGQDSGATNTNGNPTAYERYLQKKEKKEIPISTLGKFENMIARYINSTIERIPFSVKELNIVKCFSSGCLVTGTFSYYLTKDGSLLSQGCNSFGQLGKGKTELSDSFVPFHIPTEYFQNQQVLDVALGQDHVLVLTINGQVFSVGINEKGQCGVDILLDRILDFTLVKFPFESEQEFIVKVACGDEHSLCLSNLGNVYGCGYNQYNQIDPDSTTSVFGKFKKIAIQLAYQQDTIVDISCGPQYSAFLSKFGQVYMCGQNSFSQCCFSAKQTKVTSPTHINIRNEFIKKVICTKGSTTFFITRDNEIYAAGSNDYDMISPLTSNGQFNIAKPVNLTDLILPDRKLWQVEDIQSSPMFFVVHLVRIDHQAKRGMLNCALQKKFCDIVVK